MKRTLRCLLSTLAIPAGVMLSVPARADVVSDWNDYARDVKDAAEKQGSLGPVEDSAQTMVALSMFEALNAIEPGYTSYLPARSAPPTASKVAAASVAAHDVLAETFPAQKAQIDDALGIALAGVADQASKVAGLEAGRSAAVQVVATVRAQHPETSPLAVPYRPTTEPGRWVPTTLPTIDPWFLGKKPWFMKSPDQFRPPPPSIKGEAWVRDFNETRTLGAKDSAARTGEQTLIAKFWTYYTFRPALRKIADLPGRTLVQNARLYALAAMVTDEIRYAVADAKMHYQFWRPVTAIRSGDANGNGGSAADAAWEPLLNTPMHPEYPCGHCIWSAAIATVLEAEVGPSLPGGIPFDNPRLPGQVRTVATFEDYVREVSDARIWAGAHFRTSTVVGREMGRKVARLALESSFKPLH